MKKRKASKHDKDDVDFIQKRAMKLPEAKRDEFLMKLIAANPSFAKQNLPEMGNTSHCLFCHKNVDLHYGSEECEIPCYAIEYCDRGECASDFDCNGFNCDQCGKHDCCYGSGHVCYSVPHPFTKAALKNDVGRSVRRNNKPCKECPPEEVEDDEDDDEDDEDDW